MRRSPVWEKNQASERFRVHLQNHTLKQNILNTKFGILIVEISLSYSTLSLHFCVLHTWIAKKGDCVASQMLWMTESRLIHTIKFVVTGFIYAWVNRMLWNLPASNRPDHLNNYLYYNHNKDIKYNLHQLYTKVKTCRSRKKKVDTTCKFWIQILFSQNVNWGSKYGCLLVDKKKKTKKHNKTKKEERQVMPYHLLSYMA